MSTKARKLWRNQKSEEAMADRLRLMQRLQARSAWCVERAAGIQFSFSMSHAERALHMLAGAAWEFAALWAFDRGIGIPAPREESSTKEMQDGQVQFGRENGEAHTEEAAGDGFGGASQRAG